MSRKLRIEYPGAMCHVMNRGDQRGYMKSKWIAARLQMGTWTYVSNLLNEPPETQPQAQEVSPLCQ
jgi:hypothetical protein